MYRVEWIGIGFASFYQTLANTTATKTIITLNTTIWILWLLLKNAASSSTGDGTATATTTGDGVAAGGDVVVVVGDGTAAAATTGDGVAVGEAGLGAVVAGLGAVVAGLGDVVAGLGAVVAGLGAVVAGLGATTFSVQPAKLEASASDASVPV
jgi:hypothetical protein